MPNCWDCLGYMFKKCINGKQISMISDCRANPTRTLVTAVYEKQYHNMYGGLRSYSRNTVFLPATPVDTRCKTTTYRCTITYWWRLNVDHLSPDCKGKSVRLYDCWRTAYAAGGANYHTLVSCSPHGACEACSSVHMDCKLLALPRLTLTPDQTAWQFLDAQHLWIQQAATRYASFLHKNFF
jgi:hypothetical protein